jgi:endonuclease/exonuclease/phosphatase family metal-dependent hydrolase
MILRIVSYNIHKGFSVPNRRFVLPAMKEGIQKVGADLIFLQEVVGFHKKHSKMIDGWPESSQLEFLADRLWTHHAYGKNAVYDAGHHGNAILSKYPIVEWTNTSISTNRFEHRGVLHAVINLAGYGEHLHCLCIHLGLTARGRKVQLERIAEQVDHRVPTDAPLIIAGDFNDWRVTASRILGSRLGVHEAFNHLTGKHAASFPSFRPVVSLDRIYCRNLDVRAADVLKGSPWNKLSDHAALYAELEIATRR